MSERYAHILSMLAGATWAIQPEKLAAIREVLSRRSAGPITETEIRARLGLRPVNCVDPQEVRHASHRIEGDRCVFCAYEDDGSEMPRQPRPSKMAGVAVLPLYGFLCPKANMVTEYSGGTSLEAFACAFRSALADPAVASIVIDVDSPGGVTYGFEELWGEVFAARKVKKIAASINPTAGSGAYWIATAAEEITITPSGEAGSIGCMTVHEDITGKLEQEGVKIEILRAAGSPLKVEDNPVEPLSDEARANIQGKLDSVLATFVKSVAKGRGVSTSAVLKNFGQGRMLLARDAVAAGMADRLATLDETVARLAGKKAPAGGMRASAEMDGAAERERLRAEMDLLDTRRGQA